MADKKDLVVKMTINSTDFENGLKNAKTGVNRFVKDTETASGLFKSTMSKMVSAFSALGVAMAAKNVFTSFMNSTESMHDNWANNIGAMKDSWNAFLFQINTGNFQGLKDIIDYAKQARQALDALGDSTALFNLDLGNTQAEMTELLSTIQRKRKNGQDYTAEVNQYNQLLDNLRNSNKMTNEDAYSSVTAIFGRAGIQLGDYGLSPMEAARQARIVARGKNADVEALRRAMNTRVDVSEVGDFDASAPESAEEKLRKEWGTARYNRAKFLMTLGDITTEEKEQIENILNGVSSRDRTIAQMEKQLNRYLNGEEGGGNTSPTTTTSTGMTMTADQIAEFMTRSLQNEILNNDRIKDAVLIDIEIPEEEIIEEDTQAIVDGVIRAREEMEQLAITTQHALSAASQLGQAFSNMGRISDSTLGKIFSMLGSVITQIVQTIQVMMTLTGKETIEGIADVFANTKGDVWTKLAAAAAAAAGIAGIIASAKSTFAGSFAEGGVVGGSSYTGDRLWARVNSGEIILNQKQAAGLLGGGGQVNFVIEGSQLKGVLDNYNKTISL